MMTKWSPAEERDFQQLVRRAKQQSKDYYQRAGGAPVIEWHEPPPACPPPIQPPAPLPQPQTQPQPQPQPQPQTQPNRHYRVKRKNPLPMLDIDSETAVLIVLLWLLWQEQADIKVILAIVYILMV